MAFQITVKIKNGNKVKNLTATARQLANVLESLTGKRTVINVKGVTNGRR